MWARDEDGDVNGNNVPEDSREFVESLNEILNRSEQEVYAMLVECNMDAGEAITRLLSQGSFQQVKSKRDKKKEKNDTSVSLSQRVGRNIQNREYMNDSDHYVGQTQNHETSNVQGSILGPHPSLNSDLTNVETKKLSISSGEAVPSLSVTSSRQRTEVLPYIDVVKMGLGSVKDDCPFDEKPDVPYPFSSSFDESADRRDQLGESASVSNQNLHDDDPRRTQLRESELVSNQNLHDDDVTYPSSNSYVATTDQLQKSTSVSLCNLPSDPFSNLFIESALVSSQNLHNGDYGGSRLLCDEDNNKNDETYQLQRRSFEHNQTKDPSASILTRLQQLSIENLTFGRFGSVMNGSDQPNGLPSQSLNEDFANDLSLKHLNTRDCEFHEEEEQRPRRNVSNEQMAYQIDSNGACYYHSSSNYDQTEPAQDLRFDNIQRLNSVVAPSEPSLQMQNFNTFPNFRTNAMHQQEYKREPDPQYSACPVNQSMPTEHNITTASSLGRRPSVSMTEAQSSARIFEPQMNRKAMNHHYSQPKVPSGNCGNTVNYPHSQQTQNAMRRIINLLQSSNGFGKSSGNTGNSQPVVTSGHYGNSGNYPHSQPMRNGGSNNYTYHNQTGNYQPVATSGHYGNTVNYPQSQPMQNGGSNNYTYHNQTRNSQSVATSGHYGNTVNYPQSQPMQNGGSINNTYHHQNRDAMRRIINLPQSVNGFGTSTGNTANSQPMVTSGHYGNSGNYPHSQPIQNDMPPSAFQQHDDGNNRTYHHQSLAAMLPHRNSNLPRSTSVCGSTNGSANGFGMSSDNAANSNVLNSQINGSNQYLPSIQHQNGNSNVQSGSDYYSLFYGLQNQQSQSLRQRQEEEQESLRQQQEEEQEQELDYEIMSHYYLCMKQQNSTRGNPSNQTQQQP